MKCTAHSLSHNLIQLLISSSNQRTLIVGVFPFPDTQSLDPAIVRLRPWIGHQSTPALGHTPSLGSSWSSPRASASPHSSVGSSRGLSSMDNHPLNPTDIHTVHNSNKNGYVSQSAQSMAQPSITCCLHLNSHSAFLIVSTGIMYFYKNPPRLLRGSPLDQIQI